MSPNQLLALIANGELKDGEILISIGNQYVVGRIKQINIEANVNNPPFFQLSGTVKTN